MNKQAVAKELVKVAKVLVGGGWGPLSEDTSDVLGPIIRQNKKLNNAELLALLKKDHHFMKMVKDDGADENDLKDILEEPYADFLRKH